MKKGRKKHSEGETQIPQLAILPGIAVIAVVFVILFGVLYLFLWKSDMPLMVFGGIFSSSDGTEGTNQPAGTIRLPAESGATVSEEFFLTPDFDSIAGNQEKIADLLRAVRPITCYEQTFSVSYNEKKSEMVTVLRDGNRYRVESAESLVICDGENVYFRQDLGDFPPLEQRWKADDSAFSAEDEMGIPSLLEIILDVEASSRVPKFNYDTKNQTVLLSDIAVDGLVKAVSLTFETGIIQYVSAATEAGVHLYRCFNVSYTEYPVLSDDMFAIPS